MNGKLFILSSTSGGGKTTIVTQTIQQLQPTYNITRVITYTTRPARKTEQSGVDYHFINLQEFQELIEQKFFLEWSTAYNAYYGTPCSIITQIEQGISHIAIVDRAGVRALTQAYPQAVAIWLDTPSLSVIEQRIITRATENEDQQRLRLQLAQQELASERTCSLYKYRIDNNELEKAVNELEQIIQTELASNS